MSQTMIEINTGTDGAISKIAFDGEAFIGLGIAGIEFTSVCNLKCAYCDVAAPGYKGAPTVEQVLDASYRIVVEQKAWWLNFNGLGELTTIPHWEDVVERFLQVPGLQKCLTTNLQKQMSKIEIATLARFDKIHVSMDCADAELLREIRGKAELRNITTNLMQIKAHCLALNRKAPSIFVNTVITDRNATRLLELGAYVVSCGVDGLMLIELNEEFYRDEAIIKHIRHLSDVDFNEFAIQLYQVKHMFKERALTLDVTGDLDLYVQSRLGLQNKVDTLPEGQTRLCTQLWNYGMVKGDGRISHCCSNLESTKSLKDHSFEEIMNDEEIRGWRRALLTGRDLPEACVRCHWAGVGSRESLISAVASDYVSTHRRIGA